MCSKRDIVVFLAGAFTLHTISHIVIAFSGLLPITIFNITLDHRLNMIAIVGSALITLGLLWWACKLK